MHASIDPSQNRGAELVRFDGQLAARTIAAALARTKTALDKRDIEKIRKTRAEVRRLRDAQAKFTEEAVGAAYRRQVENHVDRIARGDCEPGDDELRPLELLAAEAQTKSEAVSKARDRAVAEARPAIERLLTQALEAVSTLRKQREAAEIADNEDFGISDFMPSGPLAALAVLERRLEGALAAEKNLHSLYVFLGKDAF